MVCEAVAEPIPPGRSDVVGVGVSDCTPFIRSSHLGRRVSLESLMSAMPFARLLDIEVDHAEDGLARASLALSEKHSSIPGRTIAHGGVVHALADTAGGAAVISLHEEPTPTVDIRFDHLAPARNDLVAEAEVVRDGSSVAVTRITVDDDEGTRVAVARGVYKTGGGAAVDAWTGGTEDALDDSSS
jgi:uncharacterized protein (TIGR00369 family)